MQTKESNWVYVVALSAKKEPESDLSTIDVLKKYNKYYCPVGQGFVNEPPNYIAFRYNGKLQSIHHIEDYTITRNLHDIVPELVDKEEEFDKFVFDLGSAIIPPKDVKSTQKLSFGQKVWAMLDTLLTSDTIPEASDISKARMKQNKL